MKGSIWPFLHRKVLSRVSEEISDFLILFFCFLIDVIRFDLVKFSLKLGSFNENFSIFKVNLAIQARVEFVFYKYSRV